MLHCYNCGNDLPDNLIYCTRCGHRIDTPETPTQVMAEPVAVTTPLPQGVNTTPVITTKKKGGGLKVVVIALVSLFVLGAVVVVAGIMFWSFSKRQNAVTVNTNFNASVNRPASNASEVNVNAIATNTNAMIDNAMKQLQKAANDAIAAANQASNIAIPSSGKTLDDGTNRINFRPGAVSATAVGTVKQEATFVLRAKAGQMLTGRITSPGGCIKFEDEDASLTLETEAGDNYLTVTNSCGKPTSMVLSITIK